MGAALDRQYWVDMDFVVGWMVDGARGGGGEMEVFALAGEV